MSARRVLALCAAVFLAGALPAHAQTPEVVGTIDGATVTGTYNVSDGREAYVFGFQLPEPMKGNVQSFDCGPGFRVLLTGGPGNSPECLSDTPVDSAPFLLTGNQPWGSTLTVVPFTSFDNATYEIDEPVTLQEEAPPPPPAQSSSSSSSSSASSSTPSSSASSSSQVAAPQIQNTSSDDGSSLNWLWGLLVAGGAVIAIGGVLIGKGKGGGAVVIAAVDDCVGLRDACRKAQAEAAAAEARAAAARDAAAKASSAATAADAKVTKAEKDLADAKKPRRSGSYGEDVETGRRVYTDDAKLVGAAGQASFQKYKDGEITAEQLDAEWRQQLGPGGLEELIAKADAEHAAKAAAKAKELEAAKAEATQARTAAADARAAADAAAQEAARAKANADQICKAADDCEKAAVDKAETPPPPTVTPPKEPRVAGADRYATAAAIAANTPPDTGGGVGGPPPTPPGPCAEGTEKTRQRTEHFNGLPIGDTPVHVVVRDETQGVEPIDQRMSVDEFVARFRFRPAGMSTDLARGYSVTVTVDVVDRIVTCLHTSVCVDGKWGDETTMRKATDHNRRTERVYSAGTSGPGLPTTQPGQNETTNTIQRAINAAKEAMAPYANRIVDEQNFCSD